MDAETLEDEIEALAENHEADVDEVREEYEDKLSQVTEKIQSGEAVGVADDEKRRYALSMVRSSLQKVRRTGEAIEVPFLAVGNFGIFESWGEDNDSMLIGVGIAVPPDTEDENRPAGLALVMMSEKQGLDLGRAKELWQWGEHVRGWFDISKMEESFQADDLTYYRMDSTAKSRVEEADFEGSLPTNPVDLREFVNERYVTDTFALRPGEGDTRPALPQAVSRDGEDFGSGWLDLKRFKGQVVDYFRRLPEDCEPDQNPFGKYVLIDDTISSPEEAENDPNLMSDDDREAGRQPGLQVFVEPEMVQWGPDSTVEVYGTVQRNEETGQYRMNAAGVAPILPFPLDDEEGGDSEDVDSEPLGGE